MKKKIELEIFIHRKADGSEKIELNDMTNLGVSDAWAINHYGVCVGSTTLVGEYEDIEADPREALIDALEQSLQQEIADSQVRQNKIKDQIEQLRCLTHQPEVGNENV